MSPSLIQGAYGQQSFTYGMYAVHFPCLLLFLQNEIQIKPSLWFLSVPMSTNYDIDIHWGIKSRTKPMSHIVQVCASVGPVGITSNNRGSFSASFSIPVYLTNIFHFASLLVHETSFLYEKGDLVFRQTLLPFFKFFSFLYSSNHGSQYPVTYLLNYR